MLHQQRILGIGFALILLNALHYVGGSNMVSFPHLSLLIGNTDQFTGGSAWSSKKRKSIDGLKLKLYDESAYGSYSEDSIYLSFDVPSDFATDESNMLVILQVVQRIVKGSDTFIDPDDQSRMSIDADLCVFELLSRPIGSSAYILKSVKNTITIDLKDPRSIQVEYWTPYLGNEKSKKTKGLLSKSLRIKTQISYKRGEISVTIVSSATGLSQSVIDRIMRTQKNFWQTRFPTELDVALSRLKQLKLLSLVSKSNIQKRKEKQRDRIAHPEKYKQVSPSVKRGGGGAAGAGAGRYVPSSTVQARRTVVRGG